MGPICCPETSVNNVKCDGTRAETRFRLSAKWTTPFKSAGTSGQSTTGSRGVRISGNNARYTMFRGSVKSTGYTLHSPVSPSLPLPCVTVCHHISAGLYHKFESPLTGQLKCDGTRAETRSRLSAKRTSPFKSAGASVQSTTGSRGVRISGSNAGYTMFRGSVKSTGYPLHSPVSPSLPPPPMRRSVASGFNWTLPSYALQHRRTARTLTAPQRKAGISQIY